MFFYRYGILLSLFFILLLLVVNQGISSSYGEDYPRRPTVQDYEQLVKRYRYYKPDSAIYFAQKGMALAKLQNDRNGIASMWNQLGMIDDNLGEPEKSRQKYLTARSIYKHTGSREGEAAVTIRLGVVELRKGNYDRAIGYFLESLKISENAGNTYGVMEAYLTIAEGYMGQRQYDRAFQYLKKAELLNQKLLFSSLSLNIYNNFGIILREKGDYRRAIQYLDKGVNLSDKPEFYGLHITLLNNLATVYAKQGSKEKSIRIQEDALNKAREIRNYLREIQTLIGLAGSYEKDNINKSVYYLRRALALAKEKKAGRQELEILQKLSDSYKSLGNYREAFRMKEQAYSLADSVFYREMARKVDNLQAEYELVQARSKVKELNYINNEQKLEGKVVLGITAASVILLIILAGYYYRKKQLNDLLRNTNTELKESNTIKDKLFSILAHDLRTPLASIITYLDYIETDETLPLEEKRLLIGELSNSCKATLGMLNNLLKWGEMQIKGIKLNPVGFRPVRIVEQTIDLLAEPARSKSIEVLNLVDEEVEIVADPDHFEFVVRNLLSNAIKFTPTSGRIIISTFGNSEGIVHFAVEDNGVGISEDRIERIFKIDNVSTKGTNEEKGTSLGLLLCKDFIEANNGKIEVRSKLGQGSRFIFSLTKSAGGELNLENEKFAMSSR